MKQVELELITNPDMYIFIEEGLIGAVSMISNRYSKAKNPYVADYDKDQEMNYILYLDANNLYGWAMSQPLTDSGFFWLSEGEIAELDVSNITDDREEGYILEVSLEYPCSLYDNKATLLFTDTDSLCYKPKTFTEICKEDSELFDTSEYSNDHFLFGMSNKKVLEKMKDETHGVPIEEFVGLQPKMYSLLYTENSKTVEKKVAKGITNATKREIRHEHYKECSSTESNRWLPCTKYEVFSTTSTPSN